MMKKLLFPSMMCAEYGNIAQEVNALDKAGVDGFHCDVMDGTFVPNITMGTMDIRAIRQNTKKIIDVHLMIENPLSKIQWFIDLGVDLIYFHPEAERYSIKTLQTIKNARKLAGIAINPDTSVETIKELLWLCDYVMVMTVNPGFSGQSYIEFTTEKIKLLVELRKKFKYKIVVDGSCSPERIKELSSIGVDGYILGTSALFGKQKTYEEIINELRND